MAQIGGSLLRHPARTAVGVAVVGAVFSLWSDPGTLAWASSISPGAVVAFVSRPETTTALAVAGATFVVTVWVWSRLRWRIRRRY